MSSVPNNSERAPQRRAPNLQKLIHQLAAEGSVCDKTARKAILQGAESIRGRAGERVALAARRLGITLGPMADSAESPDVAR